MAWLGDPRSRSLGTHRARRVGSSREVERSQTSVVGAGVTHKQTRTCPQRQGELGHATAGPVGMAAARTPAHVQKLPEHPWCPETPGEREGGEEEGARKD